MGGSGRTFTAVRDGCARLATVAFPVRCPGCGAAGAPVCAPCLAAARPATPAPPPPGVTAWSAAFAYDGVVREWIAGAKYHGAHAALGPLAVAAARAWATGPGATLPTAPVVVTWVPTVVARRRNRGFDHARLLARGVARDLGLPTAALLGRAPADPGDAQTTRPVAARHVGPVVRVRRTGWAARVGRGPVLLVDDVATTGASVRVCAAALLAAGVPAVMACTVARTAPDRAVAVPMLRA